MSPRALQVSPRALQGRSAAKRRGGALVFGLLPFWTTAPYPPLPMRLRAWLPALALLALTASACSDDSADDLPPNGRVAIGSTIPFTVEGELAFVRPSGDTIRTIAIEIADTDSTRQRGLMDRVFSGDSLGMLFTFERPAPQGFYMRSTPTSLDIMFFAPDSTLLNVASYTTPYSEDVVRSEGAAQFVVETRAGFADRYGIVPGDRITWTAP